MSTATRLQEAGQLPAEQWQAGLNLAVDAEQSLIGSRVGGSAPGACTRGRLTDLVQCTAGTLML